MANGSGATSDTEYAPTELNLDSDNVTTFTAIIGDVLKLRQPVNYLPVEFPEDYDSTQFKKGFVIFDRKIGKFVDGDLSDDICVYYKHIKSGKQIIQYLSNSLGERRFYAIIEGIGVHDHASIPQGGPAFATYFTEPPYTGADEEGA